VGRPWLKCLGNLGPCQSWFLKSLAFFWFVGHKRFELTRLAERSDSSVSGPMATALFLAAACPCSRLWADSGGVYLEEPLLHSKHSVAIQSSNLLFTSPNGLQNILFSTKTYRYLRFVFFYQFYWPSIRNLWRLKDSGRWRFSEDNISFPEATSEGPQITSGIHFTGGIKNYKDV